MKISTKLSPPSTKTPLTEKGDPVLNHNWQRWFSDLYLHIQEQDSLITGTGGTGATGQAGSSGAPGSNGAPGSQGPQGPVGPATDVLADGGFASSTYTAAQHYDGGAA